jgi:hypothetical protein
MQYTYWKVCRITSHSQLTSCLLPSPGFAPGHLISRYWIFAERRPVGHVRNKIGNAPLVPEDAITWGM